MRFISIVVFDLSHMINVAITSLRGGHCISMLNICISANEDMIVPTFVFVSAHASIHDIPGTYTYRRYVYHTPAHSHWVMIPMLEILDGLDLETPIE